MVGSVLTLLRAAEHLKNLRQLGSHLIEPASELSGYGSSRPSQPR